MAFVFHCPLCTSTLKTGAPVPAGRSIQCPKCHHLFTTTETTAQEKDPGAFPQAPEASPAAADIPPPRPASVEDRLPPERRTERERGARPGDDYDRSRPRYADDFADRARPRSRSRYDDDEPPRRRRRYEDDADDRPRRRARRGSNRTAWIVVLLVIGLIVALIVLAGRMMDDDQDVPFKALAPGVDAEMMALAPHDTAVLVGFDVVELHKNGRFAKLMGEMVLNARPDRQLVERKIERAGLDEHDLSGVLVASSAPDGSGTVIVVRFNQDIDHDRLVEAFDATQETDGFKRFYTSGAAGGSGFFFAGKRLLVIADNRATLTKLLHHDRNQMQLPQDLCDLAAKASGPYWVAIRKDGGPAAFRGAGIGLGDDFFADFADQTDAILVSIAAQNDQLDCELGLHSKGKKAADDIAQQMLAEIDAVRWVGANNHPKFRALPPDEKAMALAIVQSATFRSDGSVAFMKYRVTIGMFEKMMQMQQNGRVNRPPFMPK